MRTGAVASIVASTISTGGAFGGYMYFRPNNLEAYFNWKGYTLAKENEEGLWKSIYEENKDSFLKDFGTVKEDEKNRWKKVRDYCNKVFKKSDYYQEIDKATKWCLDNVKTVRGQLIRNGVDLEGLMKTPAQYQVAAAVQGNPKFWDLLNVNGKDFKSRTEAYQKWCEDSMTLEPKNNLVANIEVFCRKKDYANFKDKLGFDKLKRIDPAGIKARFEKDFKDFKKNTKSKLIETIVGGPENREKVVKSLEGEWQGLDFKKFEQVYKVYCENLDKNKFDADYETLYSNYTGICAVPDEKVN